MSKRTTAALAALLALSACGGGARDLSYGPAMLPTPEEQAAADQAQTSLGAGRAFTPVSEPTAASPGLADAMAASLGGTSPPTAAASTGALALAGALPDAMPTALRRSVSRALGLPGAPAAVTTLPAECVAVTEGVGVGSVVWSGCFVQVHTDGALPGDGSDVTLRVDGRLDWSGATGVTSWGVTEVITTTTISDGQAMSLDATVRLDGTITVGPATISGHTASAVSATMALPTEAGPPLQVSFGLRTGLELALGFQADPFCVTSGTLTLEQRWTRRPMGARPSDLPDQGWRFEWSGCGQVSVAHGH